MKMKYKLTNNKKEYLGKTLFQIEATADFGIVKKGESGGWIEKESNLSQYGNAWVSGNARVSGNAEVSGNSWVSGNAEVSGNARVYGNARVSGTARVDDDAWVYDDAEVSGNAWVSGNARVYGKLKLTVGFFFGFLKKDEKLEEIETEEGNKLLWKK